MKLFLTSILSLSIITLISQTTITVWAPYYVGKYALLNASEDLVTYNDIKLDKQYVDSSGKVTLKASTEKALKAYIDIGNASGFLYLDPNQKHYEIYFPPAEKDARKFANNTVALEFIDLPENDLNALIIDLNAKIDHFLFGDSAKIQRMFKQNDAYKDSIEIFKQELINDYQSTQNKYLHQYIKYSVAGMEQLYLSKGLLKNKIYLFEVYINEYPILYENDAYMSFFQQNFESFFLTNLGLFDKIKQAVEGYQSAEKLDEVLVNSPFLKNDAIRELVTIINLKESYYKKTFKEDAILTVLKQIQKETTIEEHKTIIKNLFEQLYQLDEDTKAPSFELIDIKGDTLNLEELKGKFVYVQFWATWSQSSLQELKIMESMYEKYGKYVEFLSISVDDNEQEFIKFKQHHPQYKWHFAHYKGDNRLLTNYEVQSIPSYVLIDEEGKIKEPHALSPAPNYPQPSIDKTFFYIKKQKEPHTTREIGGRN